MLNKCLEKNRGYIPLIVTLFALGILTRMIADRIPSAVYVVATGTSSLLGVLLLGTIMPSTIADRADKSIFIVSCAVGGVLNMVVKTANGGYMPVWGLPITYRYWMPMDGAAKLSWMGDWLFGGYSVGDILVLMGLLWLVYCAAKWRLRVWIAVNGGADRIIARSFRPKRLDRDVEAG